MITSQVTLQPVDALDVTILVDNAVDILAASNQVARVPPLAIDWSLRKQVRAEHGYALSVAITREGHRDQVLYDAGLSRDTLQHNMDVLGLDFADLRTLVMSHGHADHHGGLEGILARAGKRSLPLILHPDIWTQRRVVFPTGNEALLPPPSHNDLHREGWDIFEERGPSLLLDSRLLVTGQVERTTEFEKGMPIHQRREGDRWQPDPWIWDDQAVVVNVRDRGLVIMSSCSHAGAINIIRHAQRLTGIDKLHAFVGGFHLTGGIFERIIPETVAQLQAIAPDYVVPGHCTGWRATSLLATVLQEHYLLSSVGTSLHFAPPAA